MITTVYTLETRSSAVTGETHDALFHLADWLSWGFMSNQQKLGHFRDTPPKQSLSMLLKILKLTQKAEMHQWNER